MTLEKPSRRPWKNTEVDSVTDWLPGHPFRCVTEKNCLQITAPGAGKGNGVRVLCRNLGISPKEAVSVGNSHEDISMFAVCGYGIAPPGSPPEVLMAADMAWDDHP